MSYLGSGAAEALGMPQSVVSPKFSTVNPKRSSNNLMLTGRESLIRLVGKRRRFLPNRQSLLSTPTQGSLDQFEYRNGGTAQALRAQRDSSAVTSSGRVTCPVCGNSVPFEDNIINSHLDACLARGTKRKLSQQTLLQLNFCSRSEDKICSRGSDQTGVRVSQVASDNNVLYDNAQKPHDFVAVEENDWTNCRSLLNSESSIHTYLDDSVKSSNSDEGIYNGVDLHNLPSFPGNEMPKHDMDESMDHISEVILESFIVGRRYCDEVELNPGARISLMRDPDNVKDPNAVKVISVDSECSKVFGFLPRELAQYLAPLMDKFQLNFKGSISSVPERAFAVVPIQIICRKKTPHAEKEYGDFQVFKSLWKHALDVVGSSKNCCRSMTKYQQNFILLVEEVLGSYSHLFTHEEKVFLESFASLSDDSQRLFVRLYTRKGPWFRMSSISYPEISNCQQAIEGLFFMGFIFKIASIKELNKNNLKEILNVLTVSELHEVFDVLNKKFHCGARKQDQIAALLSMYEDGLCPHLPSVILEKSGAFIQISSTAECLMWRAERLFFLNGAQDLSAFLLVDLGVVKYPRYNCIISYNIFPDRNHLVSFEEALEVAQIVDQSLDENNYELVLRCIEISNSRLHSSSVKATQSSSHESMPTFLSRFSASWVYSKVVSLGVSFLEHEHRYSDAVNLLRQLLKTFLSDGRRGYWTLRLSIDLEHIGCLNESLSVAEDGLLDSWVRAGSRIALQRRVLRLGKPPRRWKIPSYARSVGRKIAEVHIQGRRLNCKTGVKSRFYGEDGEQCGVEQLALQYYAGEGGGWQGVHSESGIWLTIYGLLMWDIIFADIPNVFRTKFQTSPLDLETDSFYDARRDLIGPHLRRIHDGMAEEILVGSWDAHLGVVCQGINWHRHSLYELRAAVSCIGGPCLASFCQHLAQDYHSWSSGMPDLLLWRFHGDYNGEAKLVEVKGPGDRLSEQQRAWLLFLMDCGFNTEVCKVNPTISK